LFGWLWYLIAFLPMIGLVQVGNQSMADRYSYFPMIGITVALVWSIPDRLAIGRRIGLGETSYRNAVAIACGLLILILAALSFRQATFWKNSLALWNHALASTEDNAVMRVELASSYYNAGDVRQALVNATRAIELEPANWNGYWERGRALEDVDPNQAIESFEHGIKVHPNFPTAYIEIGKVLEKAGQIPDAMSAFQQASTLDPADWRAAYDLGVTQIKLQNFPAAAQCFQQALDDGITDPAIEDKVAKAVVRWNQSQQ
jgi:tetratricopeptide (TPR) repeat protein